MASSFPCTHIYCLLTHPPTLSWFQSHPLPFSLPYPTQRCLCGGNERWQWTVASKCMVWEQSIALVASCAGAHTVCPGSSRGLCKCAHGASSIKQSRQGLDLGRPLFSFINARSILAYHWWISTISHLLAGSTNARDLIQSPYWTHCFGKRIWPLQIWASVHAICLCVRNFFLLISQSWLVLSIVATCTRFIFQRKQIMNMYII
jgi:hypothetical protein